MKKHLNKETFTSFIFIILGFALRLYHADQYSLWHDEAHTWFIASQPLPEFFNLLLQLGVHPPLHFLGVKALILLIDDAPITLRSISILIDTLSIILALKIGQQLAGQPGKWVAGSFWAFSPFLIWYAADTRPYALAVFFSLFSLFLFLKPNKTRATWISLSVTTAAGLLTHFFFILVPIILTILALNKFRASRYLMRYWLISILIAFLPFAGWLYWYSLLPEQYLGIGWIQLPTLIDIPLTIWNLLSGYGGAFTLASTLFGLSTFSIILFAQNTSENRSFLFTTILLPVLGVFIISFRRPVYVDRYLIILIPFILFLVSVGSKNLWEIINKSPMRILQAAPLLYFIFGLWAALQVHANPIYAREAWSELANKIEDTSAPPYSLWFTDIEALVPYDYHTTEQFTIIHQEIPPNCEDCWWILRQPYTATHAFTQTISDPDIIWLPSLPQNCQRIDTFISPTGIQAWRIHCP